MIYTGEVFKKTFKLAKHTDTVLRSLSFATATFIINEGYEIIIRCERGLVRWSMGKTNGEVVNLPHPVELFLPFPSRSAKMSEPYYTVKLVEVPNGATLTPSSNEAATAEQVERQMPTLPAKQPFQYEHLLKSSTFSSHSLFRLNQEGYHGDSWNERFQRALALPETKIEQKLLKYTLLNEINRDFVSAAVVYAKTIISEYFIPDGEKSLRPQAIGGQAGKKFRSSDIVVICTLCPTQLGSALLPNTISYSWNGVSFLFCIPKATLHSLSVSMRAVQNT